MHIVKPMSTRLQMPKDQTITKSLSDARELLQQSQGHFNPDNAIFAKAAKSQHKLADFVGPIKVTCIPGKSRS